MNVEDDLLLAARQVMREFAIRKEQQLIEQMGEYNSAEEGRGAAQRERTTIYVPTWCTDCNNTGIRATSRGPDDWDIEECPRNHDEGRITVHFNWKREPRWFD